jgi:DNA-binding SARP family transcriptional activator
MNKLPTALISVSFFGGFEIIVDGMPLPTATRRYKAWELFVFLLLARGRAVRRDYISAHLWPESDQARGLESLGKTLKALKEAFGENICPIIEHGRKELSIINVGIKVDYWDFEDNLEQNN